MTSPEDALANALKALRVEYLNETPRHVAALRAPLERLEGGDAGALDELRREFHKLAGSGGSYGFPEISARSRAGEHEAQRLLATGAPLSATDLATLRAMVGSVTEAFAAAGGSAAR
jgi:HPt (histidine-containing phosphotransfer) domain-containing protein